MTTEFQPSSPEAAIEEIREAMLNGANALDIGEPVVRSFAAVKDLHDHLLRRGWRFESVESLVIWNWPPSRIDDDGFSILTTDIWVDIEDADEGPASMRINISLVGERDDGHDDWTLEFQLLELDELPLDQAEAFRVGHNLPYAWGDSRSNEVSVPASIAEQIAELSPHGGANQWLHRRNVNLAGGRPVDFLERGHTGAVEYALRVEIEAGERDGDVDF